MLKGRERKLTKAFLRLQSHDLFQEHFCLVRRPNEKGNVERLIGFARRNFLVPVPEVGTLEVLKGDDLDQRENILFVGPSGTGKSHLATALGMAACAQGRKVRYFRVTELITQRLEAREERLLFVTGKR